MSEVWMKEACEVCRIGQSHTSEINAITIIVYFWGAIVELWLKKGREILITCKTFELVILIHRFLNLSNPYAFFYHNSTIAPYKYIIILIAVNSEVVLIDVGLRPIDTYFI